ncbi:zinc ABC transporter substrate-binding protein [Aeromicrobium halocynthiae]|uniref:Zinc ABC transporter substrate-binding protein n=1 Tax=Aeromicrobium halocynthiae TaxID=560557 RepID=A0ABN2W0D0_9ACTN
MRKTIGPLAAALLTVPALAACGAEAGDDADLTVVASFYPVAFVSERVAGDLATVDVLIRPGTDAHDLELTPQQIASVQDADLVVYQSGFQAAVDDAVAAADRDPATVVDSAEGVELIEGGDHGDDHAHEDEADDHSDHDHGPNDPHLWLDPANMVELTRDVESALATADPDNAETYAANAESLVEELETLDADFAEGVATCERREIVVSHEAFGYLARTYDLEQIAVNGLDPSNEPSAAQLARISDLVQEEGITTVFTERLASSAVADTVAREAGVETAVLDPIEGLSDETSDEDYISLMRQNLEAITQANACS